MINYAKIDHANRRIVIDRTFAKNSEIVGSDEYNKLQDCRKDYPTYSVVRRRIKTNPNQEHYGGLTYRYMEDYIMTHESTDTVKTVIDEFSELKLISKGHSKGFRYPTIKKWFLERYPDFAEFGMTDEQIQEYRDSKKVTDINEAKASAPAEEEKKTA